MILAEKKYPTTAKLLRSLQENDATFPIQSITTLWRWMKRLGFEYKRTSKILIPLDSVSFMAQRAKYFAKLDEIRSNGTAIYYHDETWANSGEEKRTIWFERNTGSGRLRNNDTRGNKDSKDHNLFYTYMSLLGTRIAISAIISENAFHLPTVDIFKCEQDHNMDGNHFVEWISRTSSLLRQEHGNIRFPVSAKSNNPMKIVGASTKISIIIDNATWHNQLTEDTKPPKRSWNKQKLIDWLDLHQLSYPERAAKAELLEIAFENAPKKKYVVDEAAKIFNVDIIR